MTVLDNINDIININNKKINNSHGNRNDINNKIPWVDKYRPCNIDDILQQDEVIKVLRDTLITGNLPHLLFHGSPGTGKTSTILAMVNELFGNKVKERVLELNASDDRGINIVREKITKFAKSAIGSADLKCICPPYKIIILDEADAMTTEAQSALRKLMEESSKITRFCFICNYINQIIEPIASRCMKFRFKSINYTIIAEKMKFISLKEGMILSDEIINIISKSAMGDVRRAIMLLQNMLYIYKIKKGNIVCDDVYELTNVIPMSIINNIWSICIDKNIINISDMINVADDLKKYGYPANTILDQFKNKIINCDLPDTKKSLIVIQISVTERRLIEGAHEYIQLLNLLCYMKGIICDIINYYPSLVY